MTALYYICMKNLSSARNHLGRIQFFNACQTYGRTTGTRLRLWCMGSKILYNNLLSFHWSAFRAWNTSSILGQRPKANIKKNPLMYTPRAVLANLTLFIVDFISVKWNSGSSKPNVNVKPLIEMKEVCMYYFSSAP